MFLIYPEEIKAVSIHLQSKTELINNNNKQWKKMKYNKTNKHRQMLAEMIIMRCKKM